MKTYYSVDRAKQGSDWKRRYWFTDLETAKEFSKLDYADPPITHNFANEKKIALAEGYIELQFVDRWTGETWNWKAEL